MIRALFSARLLACGLLPAAVAQDTDMSGDWHVWSLTVSTGPACTQFLGNEVIYNASLSQDALGNLTGTVTNATSGALVAPVSGTVVGTQVTLSGTAFVGTSQTTFIYNMQAPAGANSITGFSDWTFTSSAGSCSGQDTVVARRRHVSFCDATDGACPCANDPVPGTPGGCLNSTGQGAVLGESGVATLSGSTLVFHISGARPSQPGMFLQGSTAISLPFRDGRLCMGNPTERLEVAFTDASGNAISTVDISAAGSLFAAQPLRYYQYWYRDPQVSPCGTGSNFSNALEITWLP
jgi:hypothetical protein